MSPLPPGNATVGTTGIRIRECQLGLEQYEAIFRDNDIDPSILLSLTNEDLKDIGVASLGHRRKLLDAIAVVQDEESRAASIPPGHKTSA